MIRELTPADAQAVIVDLVGVELGLAPVEVTAIDAATRLDADGIGIDSLALFNLAAVWLPFFGCTCLNLKTSCCAAAA